MPYDWVDSSTETYWSYKDGTLISVYQFLL